MSKAGTATPRRRGRPPKVRLDLGLGQAARVMRVKAEYLGRLLKLGLVPGAELNGSEWVIPQRGLLALITEAAEPPRLDDVMQPRASIAELSAALSVPIQTLYGWTRAVNPVTGKQLLPTHRICGHVRVYLRDVAQLPESWPDWAPGRPSFFSEE